ncbi:hypothetical protein AB0D29_15040 [Streptomyces sp. NPDC048424]|uniref:hypothetical protein n=1 Tax=Streptomyces sp. NPDC048424 TaxID=3155265 RepID=UPI0034422118
MRGDPYLARLVLGFGGPKVRVRGTGFAGVVEAVGKDVTRLRPGDEVFGEAEGAFAERADQVRVPHAPVTSAPNASAIRTANVPTPPDAPLTRAAGVAVAPPTPRPRGPVGGSSPRRPGACPR